MNITALLIYNLICTYSCIVPIIYYIVYRKELKDKYVYVFILLILSFCVELIQSYGRIILHRIIDITNIYFFLEIIIIQYLFKKHLNKKLRLISYLILIAYVIFGLLIITNILAFENRILFGVSRFILLILIILPIINLTENRILKDKSNIYLLIALFQYATLTTGIYTFIDFIAKNKQYHFAYTIFHSAINLLLYGLILKSMIIVKEEINKRKLEIKNYK